MDLTLLASRITASRLLTDAEKTYWAANLPKMNAEQLSKLDSILGEAEKINWTESAQNYLSLITKTTAAVAA